MLVRLDVVGALGDAWVLYTRHLLRLVAMAFVVFGFLALVDAVVDSLGTVRVAVLPVSVGITIVGVFWLQGALVLVVQELRERRLEVPIGDVFQRVEPHLWRLVAAGLLAAAGIVAGLALFVLPGIVALTYWSLITPAIVLESAGPFAAFRRSMRLVGRNGFRVFVVIALTIVLATIVGVVIRALLEPLPTFVDVYVANVVANSVTVPYVALAWTLVYYQLR